jgi:hypothetical protein
VQDDIAHSRFYWLQTDLASAKAGDEIISTVSEQEIQIQKSSAATLTLLLNDRLLNLDLPITVILPDGTKSEHRVIRTVSAMATSLQQRNDPQCLAEASISVTTALRP